MHGLRLVIGRAGTAHLLAIIFLAVRLAYVRSSQVDRFKLTGVSWWLHLLQAAAAAACLLINLFLLNGRLATSRASLIPSARLRGVSPYEWVGEAPASALQLATQRQNFT